MKTAEMLRSLCTIPGVCGQEGMVNKHIVELIQDYAESITTDPLGNLIVSIIPPVKDKPHIMIEAHVDEIGLIVTGIDDKGFIRVSNCGGIDRRALLGKELVIHGDRDICGVVVTIPPHLQESGAKKKNPAIDDILIDTGMSKERLSKIVREGSLVSFALNDCTLQGGLICTKAADNRAGVCAVIKAIELLGRDSLQSVNCGLTLAFTTQEELGRRGAATAAYSISPDVAVVVDTSFAHTPDAPEHKCGKQGNGPMIGISPVLDRGLSEFLTKLSADSPHQFEVMGGETGTNADAVGISGRGVKTALLSVPIKYMHTPAEVVDTADIDATAGLLAKFIKQYEV
ncbi:MAG: M42 family peptidase [Oscillospiraceae bacterium]|nr:M42 family peptidase [Oscillospiraceae bacterium]